jgi:hypothetical protein
MYRFKPILLILLLLSTPVKAQLWEYIVTSEHGNRYMIDPLSIKRQGSEVTYIQLTNYPKDFESGSSKLRSIVQYKSNDCAQNKFAITHLIGYEEENAKGSIVVVEMGTKNKWLEVTPGKIADIIHQEICNYKY